MKRLGNRPEKCSKCAFGGLHYLHCAACFGNDGFVVKGVLIVTEELEKEAACRSPVSTTK